MIRHIQIDDLQEALELLLLQQIAYQIEMEQIGLVDKPPLMDSPQALKQSGESFLGCYDAEGKLIGALSFRQNSKEAHIVRLMVHPAHFRQGAASKLITHLEQELPSGTRLIAASAADNMPALRLYTKHGFIPTEDRLLSGEIKLTQLQKITK